MKVAQVNLEDENSVEQLKQEFDVFLSLAYEEMLKDQDVEEQKILGRR